jgi:predicted transcriptional regulator
MMSPPPQPTTCRTIGELAALVGRSERTLQRHQKKESSPRRLPSGEHDVKAWQKFLADHNRDLLPDSPEVRQLKLRKLAAEVEDREHKVAELRKQFVRRSAVDERWQFHTQRCVAVLNEMSDRFADEIVGLDAVEIRKRAEHFVDHFTMRMRSGN